MSESSPIRYYHVTSGKAQRILQAWCDLADSSNEARLEFAERFGCDTIVACEGPTFGLVFPKGKEPDEQVWRYDKKIESWVPRASNKEGKRLLKAMRDIPSKPTGFELCCDLGLSPFSGGYMRTPGFRRLQDGAFLLRHADPTWKPPRGTKRISDIEHEKLAAKDERKRKK